MAKVRLTAPAKRDIATVLEKSLDTFGTLAQHRYRVLIRAALRDLASDPFRVGSKELGSRPGVRVYHLANSRDRGPDPGVRNPRHQILYRMGAPDTVAILRVLHDAMDPDRHLP